MIHMYLYRTHPYHSLSFAFFRWCNLALSTGCPDSLRLTTAEDGVLSTEVTAKLVAEQILHEQIQENYFCFSFS